MDHIADIRAWLEGEKLDALIIASTDAFLSEFAPPSERRLEWATGFSGSTGLAVVAKDAAALFVDGRYTLQAGQEVNVRRIEIEAATIAARREWMAKAFAPGARIGLDPEVHAMADFEIWRDIAQDLDFHLDLLAPNPVDALWGPQRPERHDPLLLDYPVKYSGRSREKKCADLIGHVRAAGLAAMLIADPEDVAWLFNVRAEDQALRVDVGSWAVVPSSRYRVLAHADGPIEWFVDPDRLEDGLKEQISALATLSRPDELPAALQRLPSSARVGADGRTLPADLAMHIASVATLVADDYVAQQRWIKDSVEIENARRVHIVDAAAVVRLMAWLDHRIATRTIDEFDVAAKLEEFRSQHPDYLGASMPCMAASGVSGAQPHYVPRRGNSRRLNDHPLFWMDSGGQYRGGTTDNTITMAVGEPEPKHVAAHTLVLQGFIALATLHVPCGTKTYSLNAIARQALWREGMDFGHGTGHGVGNLLNIHEGPMISSAPGPLSDVAIEAGMILTNEPGYYAAGDFGLRIESHLAVEPSDYPAFLRFDTISRLPIDPRLVDFAKLTARELAWLGDYHAIVLKELSPLLDPESAAWLRKLAAVFQEAMTLANLDRDDSGRQQV